MDGSPYLWGTLLLGMQELVGKYELRGSMAPPLHFCPIPWWKQHRSLPLGLWFDRQDERRWLFDIPVPSRIDILEKSYCCPLFIASAAMPEEFKYNGDVFVHAEHKEGTLLKYLVRHTLEMEARIVALETSVVSPSNTCSARI